MDLQHSLLSVLYILLIIIHSYTWTRKDFHRKLISVFSVALLMRATSTLLITLIETSILANPSSISKTALLSPSSPLSSTPSIDALNSSQSQLTPSSSSSQLQPSSSSTTTITPIGNARQTSSSLLSFHEDIQPRVYFIIRDVAQLLRILSTNLFILFLLIIAKGWPITRRDIPFKYAFAIFWTLCLMADLIIFYWAKNQTLFVDPSHSNNHHSSDTSSNQTNNNTHEAASTTLTPDPYVPQQQQHSTVTSATLETSPSANSSLSTSPSSIHWTDHAMMEQYDGSVKLCSFLLRSTYMIYFLSQLRTTMTLEQEQGKLQFYLHFGALSMVWFVHSVIVYAIALRVDKWQAKLISGFSSAADFLAFAVTTRLLWPRVSRSYLFRKPRSPKTNDFETQFIESRHDDDACADANSSTQCNQRGEAMALNNITSSSTISCST